jgi:hypothetical protein
MEGARAQSETKCNSSMGNGAMIGGERNTGDRSFIPPPSLDWRAGNRGSEGEQKKKEGEGGMLRWKSGAKMPR